MPVNGKRRKAKYLNKNENGKWEIRKNIKGQWHIFGEYNTFRQAKEQRNKILEIGWEKYLGEEISSPVKNYSKTYNGKYAVTKTENYVLKYYGVYDTEEEAQLKVEELKKNNWRDDTCREYPIPETSKKTLKQKNS